MPKLPVTVDTKGRVRTSKEQRRIILAEFERSGISATQFAQRTGLKYSTLAGWVHRYGGTKRPGRRSAVRLLEAVVAPAPLMPALKLELPGGARLEIREAGQILLAAALVRALEKPC
jgi:transposase-like protein